MCSATLGGVLVVSITIFDIMVFLCCVTLGDVALGVINRLMIASFTCAVECFF